MNARTAEEEDISAASFPQSQKFLPDRLGGLRPAFSIVGLSLNYTDFPYANSTKLLHMRDMSLIAAPILATP